MISLADPFFISGNKVYATGQKNPINIIVKAGQKNMVPQLVMPGTPAPDLIPEKGVLLDFTPAKAQEVDHFIEPINNTMEFPVCHWP